MHMHTHTGVFFNNIFKFHAAYDATIEYVSGGRICKSAKHLNDAGIFIIVFPIGQLCYTVLLIKFRLLKMTPL